MINTIMSTMFPFTPGSRFYQPFHDTVGVTSPNSGSDWLRAPGTGHNTWLHLSLKAWSTTYRSTTAAGTAHNRCTACATWLWTRTTNTVRPSWRPAQTVTIGLQTYLNDLILYNNSHLPILRLEDFYNRNPPLTFFY